MITPEQLAKSGSEAAHQTALFAWAAVACTHGFEVANDRAKNGAKMGAHELKKGVPELKWLHHIPNGGSRGDNAESRAIRGGQLKAQGVRVGVADLFLPVPIYEQSEVDSQLMIVKWCGLYIEMKKPSEKPKREGSKGGVSDEQAEFGEFVKAKGYGWIVCYSWEEAAEVIEKYLTYSS